jgi:FtsP/CotA-like multicopper oxidase with cupredoxin domain
MRRLTHYFGGVALVLFLIPANASAGGYKSLVRPQTAFDFNPDPDVVEVVLNARQQVVDFGTGNKTAVWTYNGTIPGPTIEADVGDKVIVHFINSLPEETTIHWHGVELPANMDGSNISQLAVPSGGYFRYEFDVHRPAMYWYHPHIRSNVQIEQGLYGTLMVHDPQQNAELNLPKREHYLVLDDVLLDDNGQIAQPFPDDPLENAVMHANGREGNTLLVNGRTDRKAHIKRGRPQRLRVVNVSNTRFMRISIPTDTVWRIGGDGGLLEHPQKVEPITQVPNPEEPGETISDPDRSVGVLLSPGERADLVFTPKGRGDLALEWHDFARGRHTAEYADDGSITLGHMHGDGHLPPQNLMTFDLYGRNKRGQAYRPPENLRDITPIDTTGAETIQLTFGHTPPDENGDITLFAQTKNGNPLPFDQVTPADAPVVNPGDTRIIENP